MIEFLTMEESNELRLVCREFREAVMDYPWIDAKTVIKGSVRTMACGFYSSAFGQCIGKVWATQTYRRRGFRLYSRRRARTAALCEHVGV